MGHVTLHSVLAWGKKRYKEGLLGQLAKFKYELWIRVTSVLGVLLLVTTQGYIKEGPCL